MFTVIIFTAAFTVASPAIFTVVNLLKRTLSLLLFLSVCMIAIRGRRSYICIATA